MSQPIGACILVFNSKGQLLLGKRLNSYKAGYFGFPGGRIEVGELVLDCAKRELKEETGLSTKEVKYLGLVKENQGDYDFIHFVCNVNVGDQQPICIEPEKCENWDWFDLNKLPKEILEGHLAAIKLWKEKKNFIEI
ncbi:MAG: NUDIX domain-containing protein [Patescibacteria group bacterium]